MSDDTDICDDPGCAVCIDDGPGTDRTRLCDARLWTLAYDVPLVCSLPHAHPGVHHDRAAEVTWP